jgi:hypothetical protein
MSSETLCMLVDVIEIVAMAVLTVFLMLVTTVVLMTSTC